MTFRLFNCCNCIKSRILFCILFNLWTFALKYSVQAKTYYTVIAPTTLGQNGIYAVFVSSHNADIPVKFNIDISGPSYNQTNSAELPTNTLLDVEFETPFLEQGEYRLMIESLTDSLLYRNATELRIKEKKIFAYEEIEKPVYEPGEILKFRVFLFDWEFFPLDIKDNVRVYFTASEGFFLKVRHLDVSHKGVLTGFAQLPDTVSSKWWYMEVYLGDKRILKSGFEVRNSVMELYDVQLTATPEVSIKYPNLKINISAQFKYGQPVEGNANLKIETKCYSDYEQISVPMLHKEVEMHNGRSELDLNLISHKKYIQPGQYCNVKILAEVQPRHYHATKKAVTSSKLFFNQYQIKYIKQENLRYFVPNKMHLIPVSITFLNGSVIQNYKKLATLIFVQEVVYQKFPLDAPQPDENSRQQAKHVKLKKLKFLSYPNENGQCTFKVVLPQLMQIKGFKNQFKTELIFDGELYKLNHVMRQNGSDDIEKSDFEDYEDIFKPEKNSLEILLSNNYKEYLIGEKYNLTIHSIIPFSYITYNLIARGGILHSKRLEFDGETTRFNMSIEISRDMFPSVAIYAFFIDEHGIFHSDEKLLPITLNFTNKIEVFAPAEAEPGSHIMLRIKTTPNSKITLWGYDHRYADIRSGKIFNQKQYLQDVLKEENIWKPFRDYVSYYPGTKSGVFTLTNAHYAFEHKKFMYANQNDDDLASEYDLYDNNLMSFEIILPNQERNMAKLQYSKQSFEFLDIKSSENGEILWNLTVPNAITIWKVAVTSWNPKLEIGMAETFFDLKVIKKFFIKVLSPENYAKRGTEIKINAIFTNNYNAALDVQVVFEENSSKFEITEKSASSVQISANGVVDVDWTIRPKVFGIISLKISGFSSVGNDVVETSINVLPEGNMAPLQNSTYGINLFEIPNFHEIFEPDMPKDAIANSQIINIYITSDLLQLLAPHLSQITYKNEEKSLETSLNNYLSNYMTLKYKNSKGTLTRKMEKNIQQHIDFHYDTILNYRLKDGSFKVFENSSSGSTYWTAHVLLIMPDTAKCKEDNILSRGLEFLASCQTQNGSFIEKQQTGTTQPMDNVLLTAFVLLAFLEKDNAYLHQMVVKKGLTYLKEQELNLIDERSKNVVGLVLSKSDVGKSTRSAEFRRIALGESNEKRGSCWCYFYENPLSLSLCLMQEIMKTYDQNNNMSITIKTTGIEPFNEFIQINRTSGDSFYLKAPMGTESVTINARGMGLATVLITFSYYK